MLTWQYSQLARLVLCAIFISNLRKTSGDGLLGHEIFHGIRVFVPHEGATANTHSPGHGHGHAHKEVKSYLVVRNKFARLIYDNDSIANLNLDPNTMQEMTEDNFLKEYTVGEPLPPLGYKDKSPDDCVRIYSLRSSIFNGDDLYLDFSNVGEYMNPSVMKFRGRLLLVTPLQIGFTGSEHKPHTGTIEFKWLNSSRFPFYTTTPFLGIENEVRALNDVVVGEDPRALYFNDSYFQLYFTFVGHGRHHQKMGVAEFRYIESEGRINVTYQHAPIVAMHPLDNTRNQKNWSPFTYENKSSGETNVYMIQSIHPLIVLEMTGYGTNEIYASIKSNVDYPYMNHLGDLRGGTNAIRLHDRYLSFFHIRTRFPWNSMTSYVYGAYTFTTEPPFTMLSISPTPIMEPRELYSSSWSSRYIDYCVYPMHIFMLEEHTDVLHISFGFQDRWGFVGTMNLTKLLLTLAPMPLPFHNNTR